MIAVLTESPNPRKYWSVLKTRLKKEGSELTTNCSQLKTQSADGKFYLTDVADTEQLFRLLQSVSSKKAEPFKLWLAKVGRERIGYSKEWINQRLKSIEVRKELTDEWDNRGVNKGQEYAILTDEITKACSGFSVKQYKNHKGLKKENLRDNMTNLELVLNMLAEATTTEISKEKKPKNFTENKIIAKQGGTIAGNTRKEIEAKTGKKVVTPLNAKNALQPTENMKQIEKSKKKKKNQP